MKTPRIFRLQDDSENPAPQEVYNWRIYALALAASMGSSMFGYDSGFIGGTLTLPSFTKRFGLADASDAELSALKANIVSLFQAGCFFGVLGVYPITEKLGRRSTLILCGLLFCVGAVMQTASDGKLALVYAGRVLTGLGVGSSSMLVPSYIGECAPPAIRGRLIGIFEIALQFSLVIAFWVNYAVELHIDDASDRQWHIPFALQLIPGSLLAITMFFQPESPRWLIRAGRVDDAVTSLTRIRRLPADHSYIVWECDAITEQIRKEDEIRGSKNWIANFKEAFSEGNRKRLFIGIALNWLQNLSGINALNYFSPSIFQSIGFTGTSVGLLATGIFGIVKAVATLFFMMFGVDNARLGRRISVLVGSTGAIVAMFYVGAFACVTNSFDGGDSGKSAGAYVAIVFVYVFAVFYAISWNGIPWIFCAEVFPTSIRATCLLFTTSSQWLAQFVVVYSTPYMMESITYGTFFFFGSWLVVGIVFVWFFLPETKGLSLEDMDILFSLKGTARKVRPEAEQIIRERQQALEDGVVLDRKEDVAIAHLEKV